MLARIRRNAGDASSLISPLGRMHRRMAASTSRKSPTFAARVFNSGNFAASSRNCTRSNDQISTNDAASRNSAASSATPGPSILASHVSGSASPPNPNSFPLRSHSCASRITANCSCKNLASRENASASIARRPGVQVVLCRSNSRSLSNSSTSCALLLILLPCGGHLLLAPRGEGRRAGFPFSFSVFLFSVFEFGVSNFGFVLLSHQCSLQKIRRLCRCCRCMHQFAVRFAPHGRMSQLYFSHALQDGRPKIAQHHHWFSRDHGFVQHLPHHRKFHKRSRAAFARHKAMREPHQFKQSFLPGLHANFFVNPSIDLRLEKFRGNTVRFCTGASRAARHCLHHAAIATAANGKPSFAERPSKRLCFLVIGFVFARTRTAKACDDPLHCPLFQEITAPLRSTPSPSHRTLRSSRCSAHPARPSLHDSSNPCYCLETKIPAAFRSAV